MKKKRNKKNKFKFNKKLILIIIILIILAIAVSSLTLTGNSIKSFFGVKEKPQTQYAEIPNIVVTKQNIAAFLQSTSLVQELPGSAELELKLYNFNSGERQWEESYVVKKGQVYRGTAENPDVVALLSSNYLNELNNFCATVQKANLNGDLAFEYKKNKAKLLWKYKSMNKYKSCLGI